MINEIKNTSITLIRALTVIIILSFAQVFPVSATIYFFSTTGNDNNDGLTQRTPKQTLTTATKLMNPGNTILFKRGDKWYNPVYEWNFLNKKGTPEAPILIDAYGKGAKPIIACMELMTSGWTNEGSNRWSHPLGGYTDARRCFVNGVSKRKVSDPDSVDCDYKFAVASSTIHIYSATVPGNVEVINNSTTYGCLEMTNCSFITIRNIEFRGSSKWSAVEVREQSSHITFDSCNVVELYMYGIMFNNSTRNYELYHESPVVKNCYLNMGWTSEERTGQSWGGDGINFRNAVRNGLIQRNTVVNFQHCGITLELESSPDYAGVNNNIVERNEVYLTSLGYCHGFDVQGIEGKATGNIFRRNYFHDLTNSGHLLGNGNYMYSNIFNNIIMGTVGSTTQPYAVDIVPFKWKSMQFISKNNVFVNNTIYDTDASSIRITGPTQVYENIFKNNIIMKWAPPDTVWSNYGFRNDGSCEPLIVENNCIYNYGRTGGKVIRQGDKSDIYTVKEANDAFSNYNNNIDVDPLFVNPENADFHLKTGSPCKTSGQVLSAMGIGFVDYYGNAWADPPSIGAIQYIGGPPVSYDITISNTDRQRVTGWGGFPDQCCGRSIGKNPVGKDSIPLVYDAIYSELGTTISRIRLWPDCASDNQGNISEGDNFTGLNHIYYILNEARKRGVTDWSTSVWGAPAAMCVNGTRKLDEQYETQYCKWIANCINYLVNTRGLSLPIGVCAFNEPDNTRNGLPREQMIRVTKLLKTTLRNYSAGNIRNVKVVSNDNDTYHNFNVSNDTSYWNSVDIFACHSYYWGVGKGTVAGDPDIFVKTCNQFGPDKPRWMTENCPNVDRGHTPWMNRPDQLGHAISMIQQLACDMSYCGCNMWMWWAIYDPGCAAWGDISAAQTDVLLDGNGSTTINRSKTFYILKKIWNSARVGSVVHKITSTDPDFKYGNEFFADGVAFVNNGSTILVLINDNNTDSKSYRIKGLTGRFSSIFQTTSGQDMELVSSPALSRGTISAIALPPLSVTVIITSTSATTKYL